MTVSFRPIRPDDEAFLYEVYASTRLEELALVDWDDAQKAAFLRMQFTAQHKFYQAHYATTDFLIILRDDVPIGRLYIARWQNEILIVDIALLPPYRNTGIGTAILRDLLAEATVATSPCTSMWRNSTRPCGSTNAWALPRLRIKACISSWSGRHDTCLGFVASIQLGASVSLPALLK